MPNPSGARLPTGGRGTISDIQLVAQVAYPDRSELYAVDTGASLIGSGHKHVGHGEMSDERSRVLTAGLIDYCLDRRQFALAREYLTSFSYLSARLSHFGIRSVLRDFRRLRQSCPEVMDEPTDILQVTFEIAAAVLSVAPSQLAEQLLGRLPARGGPRIEQIRNMARASKAGGLWLRPCFPSLTGAGDNLRRILTEHRTPPTAVTFFAQGTRLASADDQHVFLWDFQSGDILETLSGHTGEVIRLAVTPDDCWLIAATRGPVLFCWRLGSSQPRECAAVHTGAVLGLAVAPDGRVLSAATDGKLIVWEPGLRRPTCLAVLPQPIQALALGPDGSSCVVASGTHFGPTELTVWDVATRTLSQRTTSPEAIQALAVSGDGRFLWTAANQVLVRWRYPDLNESLPAGRHSQRIARVACSTAGDFTVTTHTGGAVCVWDHERGSLVQEIDGHRTLVRGLALDGAGTLVTAADDRTIRISHFPPRAKAVDSRRHAQAVNRLVAGTHAGHDWFASCSEDHSIRIWDARNLSTPSAVGFHTARVRALAAQAKSRTLVSAGWDGTIRTWDTATGRQISSITSSDSHLQALALDSRGRRAAAASFEGPVRIWDLHHRQELACVDVPMRHVTSLHWLPGDTHLIIGGRGFVVIEIGMGAWRVAHQILTMQAPPPSVNALALPRDSWQGLAATADGRILKLDFATGDCLAEWQDSPCGIADLAFSGDEQVVATVGSVPLALSDDTLRLWNPLTGQVLARLITDCPLRCCCFLENPRQICVGDQWGRLHVFHVEDHLNEMGITPVIASRRETR